ncbi:MAG: CpXC domain-containing protein [Anaerolineae bacterium]|nr:CpXC domain-containing protein [Anaerolineae bacterium]
MPNQTNVRCPNCGIQFTAPVETVIDVAQNSNAKMLLLAGSLNAFQCPNCGSPVRVATPFLYHDGSKELLLVFVPPELNLPKTEREKAIGDLMRELTAVLPQGSFKSYMFQPRESLTLQGLVDTILQADGVTPEMMREQRERLSVLESLLGAPEETRQSIIEQNDSKIDTQFMQTLSLLLQRMVAEGQVEMAQQLANVQEDLLSFSSFGQSLLEEAQEQEAVMQEVAQAINQLGSQPTRADFLALAKQYAGDIPSLHALVGLIRPAFDYEFFQGLTAAIGQAPADEREGLETLRDQLLQLAQDVDAQTQAMIADATKLLQILVGAPDEQALEALIHENVEAMDEAFLSVLLANLQQAENQNNTAMVTKLSGIYEHVLAMLREQMPPALRFVNELLGAPSPEEQQRMLDENAKTFGEELLFTIDAVTEAMAARGEETILQRLADLRSAAETALD